MFNKKGAVPIEEISGLIIYMVVGVIIILSFYGCNINSAQKTQEKFKVSKSEISVISELNFFLNFPITEDKKVLDLIIESYINNDYSEFDKIAKNYFSKAEFGWRLSIFNPNGDTSIRVYSFHELYSDANLGGIIAQSQLTIPLLNKNPELITILFQIREKPDVK